MRARNDAVIFPIKTARHKGGWRPVVLPYSQEYEKWTKPLYEWFNEAGPKNPFDLSEFTNAQKKHHGRYYQWKADEVFKKIITGEERNTLGKVKLNPQIIRRNLH